jgi:fucose 4-O-acetylase-like acetyltransferase
MPLFFMCSGMVFSTRRYASFLPFAQAKARSLVVPYVLLGLTLWLLCEVRLQALSALGWGSESQMGFCQMLISLALGHRLHEHYYSLWFLTSLFLAELLFYPVTKVLGRRWRLYIGLTFCCTVLQWVVMQYVKGWYWSADLVPIALAYLSVGYAVRGSGCFDGRYCSAALLPLVLGINIAIGALNYRLGGFPDLFACNMGNPVLYYVAATCGCWASIIVARRLAGVRLLAYYGRNTLVVYAFQNSLLIPIALDMVDFVVSHGIVLDYHVAKWLLAFLLVMLMSCAMVEVVNRWFPWLLGRPWHARQTADRTSQKQLC